MAAPGDYLKRTTVRPWHQHAASPEKIAPAPRNALALRPAATPGRRIPGRRTPGPPHPTLHAHSARPRAASRGARSVMRNERVARG